MIVELLSKLMVSAPLPAVQPFTELSVLAAVIALAKSQLAFISILAACAGLLACVAKATAMAILLQAKQLLLFFKISTHRNIHLKPQHNLHLGIDHEYEYLLLRLKRRYLLGELSAHSID